MIRGFGCLGAALTALIAAALMLVAFGAGATAHDGHDHGPSTPTASPEAGHDHDHAVGGDLSTGVVYLTIANDGDEGDRLIGASTDRAQVVEIHTVEESNGMAAMMLVEGGLEIPAGEEVHLEPSGLHLMLIGLTESLNPDTEYELTLSFEHAGEVTVTVPVRWDAPEGDDASEPVTVDDLEITGAWSRPAPKLGGDDATPGASPEASPQARGGR